MALVTGGTGALGSAVTLDLLRAGARVAVPYTSEPGWAVLHRQAGSEHQDRVWGVKADLTKVADVDRLAAHVLQRWGRIDFLLCIAGGFAAGKSYETSEETWDQMLNLNLKTVYLAFRSVVPVMIKQNFGRIVTTSSGAILRGGAGIAAYAVSKSAVRQLTEILADELKNCDIRVHSVMPGTMDTEANRRAMPEADFSMWVKTEDVAHVIHFLLSDDARAVRSVVVPVLG